MQWRDTDADGPPIAEEDVPQQLSFRAQTGGRVTPPNTDDDLGQHLSADHRDGQGPAARLAASWRPERRVVQWVPTSSQGSSSGLSVLMTLTPDSHTDRVIRCCDLSSRSQHEHPVCDARFEVFKKAIPKYFVAAILSFSFAACRGGGGGGGCGGENPPCADCGTAGGGAVTCCTGLFGTNCSTMCAPDENLAAINCSEGGGTWTAIPLCTPTRPEGTWGGDEDTAGNGGTGN